MGMMDINAIVLIVVGIVLAIIAWPRSRPPEKPGCYGDYPFMYPVEAAERDCVHCSHAYGCHEDSPDPRR
jgi:hypothetical protein